MNVESLNGNEEVAMGRKRGTQFIVVGSLQMGAEGGVNSKRGSTCPT